jgi:hypothetical protein
LQAQANPTSLPPWTSKKPHSAWPNF